MQNGHTASGLVLPTRPQEPPCYFGPDGDVCVRADLYAATRPFWDEMAARGQAALEARQQAEAERDAALAECERLRAELACYQNEHGYACDRISLTDDTDGC